MTADALKNVRNMLARESLKSNKLTHMALSGRTLARDVQDVAEAAGGMNKEELAARILTLVTEHNFRLSRIDAIYQEKSAELEKTLKNA